MVLWKINGYNSCVIFLSFVAADNAKAGENSFNSFIHNFLIFFTVKVILRVSEMIIVYKFFVICPLSKDQMFLIVYQHPQWISLAFLNTGVPSSGVIDSFRYITDNFLLQGLIFLSEI